MFLRIPTRSLQMDGLNYYAPSTLRRRNMKTEVSLWKRTIQEFQNASIACHFDQSINPSLFCANGILQESLISVYGAWALSKPFLDFQEEPLLMFLWYCMTAYCIYIWWKFVREITRLSWSHRFSKASVFNFFPFVERFRKALFSWWRTLLVSAVGLTGGIKLCFQISSAYCGWGLGDLR